MLINQEFKGQFFLFEDDENQEIPFEEETDDSRENIEDDDNNKPDEEYDLEKEY